MVELPDNHAGGRGMIFEQIETKRKHLYVAEQILRAIKEGIYRSGDKLPPERVLAEEMGVSRNSIREALSALQVLNIVESKAGNGTYVKKSVETIDIESQVLPILEESESPFKIFEARNVLEMGVVELAIDNATPEDIEQIRGALERMCEAAETRDYEGYLAANLSFHLAIAKATANPIIERTMTKLWETTSQRLLNEMLIDYWRRNISSSIEIHKQIFTAIRDKNKPLIREVVHRHYEEPRDYLLGNLQSKGGDLQRKTAIKR
ncbi:MAG: FadR/GntR family transcriptional regulator [Candidatus Bipolaricaulia bacterium]